MTVLVTAASGRTGRSVVEALVRKGQLVRAFDVNPEVHDLVDRGAAEALVGDLLEPRDVSSAVDGVRVVIHIGPPMHPREAEMGHSIVSAARRSGVQHFVQFSVTHPQLEPLLNHQAKLAVERLVLLSRIPFTILQPMHYMQNTDVVQVVDAELYRQPYSLDTPLAHVDLVDVAEVAALVACDTARHSFATYELCGVDFLNGRQLAQIIEQVSGRSIATEEISPPLGLPEGSHSPDVDDYQHDAMFRLFDHYGRYGITGNPNVLAWLLGRSPGTFQDYVRRSLSTR
jgi:uncharacterized protein YbjT (DUF2867 family)